MVFVAGVVDLVNGILAVVILKVVAVVGVVGGVFVIAAVRFHS